jgi:hypothetical protein
MKSWKRAAQAAMFCGVAALACVLPAAAQGRNPSLGLGQLGELAREKDGTPKHEGSWDRKGGNADMRRVEPGQTLTLLDYKGAGMVRRFWVTIAPRSEMTIHRQAILRMYWDGEDTPSVECPIGDFFGVGFGEQVDYISLPLNETSGGYNCYWPMPFHKSARWTLTNMSKKVIDAFYYNIDFTAYDKLPKDLLHFHAQWRRENPTKKGENYTILEAQGKGHFVGTALYMQNRRGKGLGFLEGDEMIYVDGQTAPPAVPGAKNNAGPPGPDASHPVINGTGTEDYFSSGWYFDRGVYSAPYHGVNIKDTVRGRISTYRWHIEDAMPFKKSIKVTIEHGHANDHEADYSSVAYYYQAEPHMAPPPFPTDPAALLPFTPPPPFKVEGAIEGESLLRGAKATSGPLENQDMSVFSGRWSGEDQLWWRPESANQFLTLNLPSPAEGDYELIGYFTKAKDYGTIQVLQGENTVGPVVNLYDPEVVPSGAVSLGRVHLHSGANQIRIRVVGKDQRSQGYLVGLDAFVLKP